jgi:hypothetical protein
MMTGNCVTEFNHYLEEMYCIPCVTEYVPLNDTKIFRSCPRDVHSLEREPQDSSLQSKLTVRDAWKEMLEFNATYVTVHIFLSLWKYYVAVQIYSYRVRISLPVADHIHIHRRRAVHTLYTKETNSTI